MHTQNIKPWQHGHVFTLDYSGSERRTKWVLALTAVTMVAEIGVGMACRSMALLADGWHMGTHAAAFGIALFAYAYARRHAANPRYTFGTGKTGVLGGFASAVALAIVAIMMIAESIMRFVSPQAIQFNQAIFVAVLGLAVNAVCGLILHGGHSHSHHDHEHDEGDSHDHHEHEHHDHNLRAAYVHVLADAFTSVCAIAALLAGKYWNWVWMDPAMGVLGALVILRWAYGLVRDTSGILLDGGVNEEVRAAMRDALEAGGTDRVADLHVWHISPMHLAAALSIVSNSPRSPDAYRNQLDHIPGLAHVLIEIHRCMDTAEPSSST